MNTTLSTRRRDHTLHPQHEPEPARHADPAITTAGFHPRRVRPIDRLALHLGVALIRWGRRPRAMPPVASVDVEAVLRARDERERAIERQQVDLLRYRMVAQYR